MNIFTTNILFDSHCHLNDVQFNGGLKSVIESSVSDGVEVIIDMSTDLDSAKKSLQISSEFPNIVYSGLGVQPEVFIPGSELYRGLGNNAITQVYKELDAIDNLIKDNGDKVVMMGETGIDLYWLVKNNESQEIFCKSKEYQIELFDKHIQLAQKYSLPLSIHHRESVDVCLNVLKKYSGSVDGIFHSFVGEYVEAKKILDAGYKIGINGIITYKSAGQIRDAVKKIIGNKEIDSPKDLYDLGIYLETDSPYLGVGDLRGKRNEPRSVREIYEVVISI